MITGFVGFSRGIMFALRLGIHTSFAVFMFRLLKAISQGEQRRFPSVIRHRLFIIVDFWQGRQGFDFDGLPRNAFTPIQKIRFGNIEFTVSVQVRNVVGKVFAFFGVKHRRPILVLAGFMPKRGDTNQCDKRAKNEQDQPAATDHRDPNASARFRLGRLILRRLFHLAAIFLVDTNCRFYPFGLMHETPTASNGNLTVFRRVRQGKFGVRRCKVYRFFRSAAELSLAVAQSLNFR